MADRPNVNPTPRQEFHSNSSWLKMHREMMQQPMLSISLQFSLLQFMRTMADAKTVDGNTAAQNHFKIQGAHEFISILKNLAEMPVDLKPRTDKQQLTQ